MQRLLATMVGVVLLSASSLVLATPAYGWVEAIYFGTPVIQVPLGTTGDVGGVTLYNWNMMAPFQIVTVTSVAISGSDGADFAVVNDNCTGASLGDMSGYTGSCGVGLAFTPSRFGIATATITFEYESNVSGPGSVFAGIHAIGGPIGQMCGFEAYPKTASFWDTFVGQTATLGEFDRLRIANCGPAGLTVSEVALSGPDAEDFLLGPEKCVGTYPPTTDPWAQSCFVDLVFAPQSAGAKEATVTVYSDGVSAPQVLTLTGVAMPAADLGVSLSAAPDSDPAERGGLVTYTITVVNNGPSTSVGGFVSWAFFYPGAWESWSPEATCETYPGQGAYCMVWLADQEPGGTMRFTATARVGTSGVPGELVTSAMVGSTGTADLGYDNNSANVTTSVPDTEPPTVRFDYNQSPYGLEQWVGISCVAEDNAGIDWSRTTCPTISGPAYTFNLGAQTFSATAYDLAGYRADGSTTLVVTADYVSMKNLTGQWVTKPSVSKELLKLLDSAATAEARGKFQAEAGKLGEYRSLLKAQSGKAITTEYAQILIRFSYGL